MQAQMLYNNWFGKAVGATCAWIWAPNDAIWLAVALIVGIVLGHIYDLWASHMHDGEAANLVQFARAEDNAPPYADFHPLQGRADRVWNVIVSLASPNTATYLVSKCVHLSTTKNK